MKNDASSLVHREETKKELSFAMDSISAKDIDLKRDKKITILGAYGTKPKGYATTAFYS